MKIIVHRGTHQIGGTCLEVATASTRLILDVGLPLDDLAAPAVTPPQERTDETISEVFARAPEVAAVLISHAHADHTGLLHLVPPGVPIFLSKGTSKMMLAGSVYANQPNVPRERQQVFELRSPHRIGDITVTAFPVDHSAFDAQAFLLEADGQRVLYSGDLRLHGRKPGHGSYAHRSVAQQARGRARHGGHPLLRGPPARAHGNAVGGRDFHSNRRRT